MAYKFKCTECGRDLVVRWLKPEETAKCSCGAHVKVPANAAQVRGEPPTFPDREPKAGPAQPAPQAPAGCPSCRYLEMIDAAEFEGGLPPGAGACHRYPPAADGKYPLVGAADWCGEYERRS